MYLGRRRLGGRRAHGSGEGGVYSKMLESKSHDTLWSLQLVNTCHFWYLMCIHLLNPILFPCNSHLAPAPASGMSKRMSEFLITEDESDTRSPAIKEEEGHWGNGRLKRYVSGFLKAGTFVERESQLHCHCGVPLPKSWMMGLFCLRRFYFRGHPYMISASEGEGDY